MQTQINKRASRGALPERLLTFWVWSFKLEDQRRVPTPVVAFKGGQERAKDGYALSSVSSCLTVPCESELGCKKRSGDKADEMEGRGIGGTPGKRRGNVQKSVPRYLVLPACILGLSCAAYLRQCGRRPCQAFHGLCTGTMYDSFGR